MRWLRSISSARHNARRRCPLPARLSRPRDPVFQADRSVICQLVGAIGKCRGSQIPSSGMKTCVGTEV
jgi:hypothetical protein